MPAVLIVASVIVFPWLFTLYMSSQDWKIGGGPEFVGLQNYAELLRDPRFSAARTGPRRCGTSRLAPNSGQKCPTRIPRMMAVSTCT